MNRTRTTFHTHPVGKPGEHLLSYLTAREAVEALTRLNEASGPHGIYWTASPCTDAACTECAGNRRYATSMARIARRRQRSNREYREHLARMEAFRLKSA